MLQKLVAGVSVVAVLVFLGALGYAMFTEPASGLTPEPVASTSPDGGVKPPAATGQPPTPPAAEPAAPKPREPAAREPAKVEPKITPVAIDGADLASYLNLRIYRFDFAMPESEYTLYLWIERWTHDADRPRIIPLAYRTGVFAGGDVMVKAPLPDDSRGYVRIRAGSGAFEVRPTAPLDIPSPFRTDAMSRALPLVMGEDVHLIAYKHNAGGLSSDGLAGVERENDVTIYVKLRVIAGRGDAIENVLGLEPRGEASLQTPRGLIGDGREAEVGEAELEFERVVGDEPAPVDADGERYRFKPRAGE